MSEPQIFRIAHRLLICSHCSGNTFIKYLSRDAVRSGWFATYDLIYACANCGRLEWFQRSAEEKEEIFDQAAPTFCPACGAGLSAGPRACGHCGWQARPRQAALPAAPAAPPRQPQADHELVAVGLSEAALCIWCGADIPPFQTRCPSCDWSYEDQRKTRTMTDEEIEQSTTVVDLSEPALCLGCGADIPPFQTRCPACGWSYEDEGKPSAGSKENSPEMARPNIRASQCRACGASIPPNKESCPQCGWSPSASR
ncbi:hypothetical protein F8S13_26585 [Chloroflexia bacterium SDU3-3]|nr:hypothetical protein F8S13_26585 [Chloroflexia bacterium SDU3-3]